MDALKPQWIVLQVLLSRGKATVVGTALAVLVVIALSILGDPEFRMVCELCTAVAVGAALGGPSIRLAALASTGGYLGIPTHLKRLRDSQFLLLATSLAFAIAVELPFGRDLRTLVVPIGIVAVAAALASFPMFGGLMLVLLIIGKTVPPEYLLMAFQPAGAALIVAVGVAIVVHWFRQTQRHENQGAVGSHSLADAEHEELHASELDAQDAATEPFAATALQIEPEGQVSARKFWLGMGFDPLSSWKVTAFSLLIAVVALAIFQFMSGGHSGQGGYLVLSVLVAFTIFGRFTSMHEAWMRTPNEQAILLLSPRWPQGARLKITFLRSLWSGFPGYAVFWLALSAISMIASWVSPILVLLAGGGLLLVTLTCLSISMHYFAMQRLPERSTFAIAHLLLAAAGTGILALAWAERSSTAALIGTGLILLPTLPSIYLFSKRRLQFPVQPRMSSPG